MPKQALAAAAAAICDPSPGPRADVAATIAIQSRAHFDRVSVSEMVIDATERHAARPDEDAWGFARNCLPFVLAPTKADAIVAKVEQVSRIVERDSLEAFFVGEVRALGLDVADLRRDHFRAPSVERVRDWISAELDKAAELRVRALQGGDDAISDYAVSVWIWLGRIFARTRPCFWQGRNRWLGGAAAPDTFDNKTIVTTIRGNGESSTQLPARFLADVEARTRTQLASHGVPALDALLTSTAELAPSLAVEGWEQWLPKGGSANLVSGAVRHERLDELAMTMRALDELGNVPYSSEGHWVELVAAAAQLAKKVDAHLVEGDDVIDAAIRWPAILEP